MPNLTPETLAEWRRESTEEFVSIGPVIPRLHRRILTLLDALEKVQRYVIEYDENSVAWLIHVDGANRHKFPLEHGKIIEVRP